MGRGDWITVRVSRSTYNDLREIAGRKASVAGVVDALLDVAFDCLDSHGKDFASPSKPPLPLEAKFAQGGAGRPYRKRRKPRKAK